MKKYICILVCVFALAATSFGEINVGNASFDEGLSDAADYGDLYSYDWGPWESSGSTWLVGGPTSMVLTHGAGSAGSTSGSTLGAG